MVADEAEAAEPRRPEATATVLARLEGKLDLANYKLDDMSARVGDAERHLTKHDDDIATLRSDLRTHVESETAAVAAVKAAKDEEVRDAARRWSPAARWSTGLMTAAAVAEGIYYATHR